MADNKRIAFFNVEKLVYPKTGQCKLWIDPGDGLSRWDSKSQDWKPLSLEEDHLLEVLTSDTEIRLKREKADYDSYETRLYIDYSLQYEQGRLVGAKHAQDDFCYGGLTLVDGTFTSKDSKGTSQVFSPYFAKNEYIGALYDGNGGYNMLCAEDGTTGLYASPAVYEALPVSNWEVRRWTDIDSLYRKSGDVGKDEKDTSPRDSILVFWKDQNTRIQEITVRGNTAYGPDDDTTRVFPSSKSGNTLAAEGQMTIRYCSNYAYELADKRLSSIAGKSLEQYEVKGWYYVVNGVKTIVSNMLDHQFVWQAALTDKHRKESNPACTLQSDHTARYNLYPYIEDAKALSVTFYDYDGVELSDYSQTCPYGTAAILPAAMKAKPVGNSIFPHTGWIDHTDGRQANLVDVTHDIKCIPEYVDPLADVDGIISIDDLKRYVIDVISLQCDNVGYGECYVSHEYYTPSYSRQYGDVIRSISPGSCQYVQCVFTETLEQDVDDYMKSVDVVLREYRGKYANTGLVLLYYLAMVYFIKSTVKYVHGYKHESLGSYNACHMMYVPGVVPDFSEYVMKFDLIDDLVSIMMDIDDSYSIQYEYRHKDAKTETISQSTDTTITSSGNIIDQTLNVAQNNINTSNGSDYENVNDINEILRELGSEDEMKKMFLRGGCNNGVLIMQAYYTGRLTKEEAQQAFLLNGQALAQLRDHALWMKDLA